MYCEIDWFAIGQKSVYRLPERGAALFFLACIRSVQRDDDPADLGICAHVIICRCVVPTDQVHIEHAGRLPLQLAVLTDRASSVSSSRSIAAIVILPTISSALVW